MTERTQTRTAASPYLGLGLMVAAVFLVLDQISKTWIVHGLELEGKGRVHVMPFFDLVFVKNKGVSYGMFTQDSMMGQWFLIGFAALATLVMVIWLWRAESRLVALSLGLIISGAIGNSIDRAVYGGVIDFVSLYAFDFYWYVFNIADVAIVAGVIGLIYDSIFPNRKNA